MSNQSTGVLERLFHLSENNTTVKRECLAGLTTFVSMAYILFVNPIILGDAGMDAGAVFTATALSAIMGCLLMGFLANYPIAIAPGLGDNAFFTYSVVLAMGIPWQQAMGGVFVASIEVRGTHIRPCLPAPSNVPQLPMKYGPMVFRCRCGM